MLKRLGIFALRVLRVVEADTGGARRDCYSIKVRANYFAEEPDIFIDNAEVVVADILIVLRVTG